MQAVKLDEEGVGVLLYMLAVSGQQLQQQLYLPLHQHDDCELFRLVHNLSLGTAGPLSTAMNIDQLL